ncbi:MAG: S8 family serine peptidase, partial [Myxococcota bacterium]
PAEDPWAGGTPSSGTGPAQVSLTFDYAACVGQDEPSTTLILLGPGATTDANLSTLAVSLDIWPKTFAGESEAEMREFVKNPANWPNDPRYGGMWELWGFLPDETSHPGTGAGDKMLAWEKTPCAAGQGGDDCTRAGQAGLASGMQADTAWLLSTGDPRVVVAVLDSGIIWREKTLLESHYLNAEELRKCPPPGADADAVDAEAAFDVNGDGVFNIRDYDDAPWLEDVNLNRLRDPQDLIWANNGVNECSDGVDDDGNGYLDDISGWDFFWNDNDPSDDTEYGHGTGEANDSTAEANDGEGVVGVCPRCRTLNVRVGDSFIVDVNQFADGVIFSVASGAKVVQEALGSLNNTPYAQAAIDYAYDNGVAVIASAADERSYHHNYPGSLEHTLYVHAIVADTDGDYVNASTFLNYGNCTNWGGKLTLSTPGTGCSSEATGNTSGHAGLAYAYFEQLRDAARGTELEPYYTPDLEAEELYQLLIATTDDIDVPGAETDESALALKKYASNEGWDLQFGHGRNNTRRSLEALRDQQIPPTADIESPRWYEVFDPARTSSFEVRARIGSPRLTNLRWKLSVGVGNPAATFLPVAEGAGAIDYDKVLATVDLSAGGPLAALVKVADAPAVHPEQFAATLLLEVDGEGPQGDVRGRFRKVIAVREDPDVKEGFPLYLGASGESSPKVTDLDGDGTDEIVVGTADGRVHAIRADGSELPGFPALTPVYAAHSDEVCATDPAKCHRGAAAFTSGFIQERMETLRGTPQVHSSIVATIAVGDLDGDGSVGRDIVAATMDGLVIAWDSTGTVLPGFPVSMNPEFVQEFVGALRCTKQEQLVLGCTERQRHAESAFFSSPTLVDLDRDGDLEITVGGGDQHAYAWHHDGTTVNGWPVHLRNDAVPAFDSEGDVLRYDGRIISSAAVADILGDGTPVVFYGSNERIENNAAGWLYAIVPEGNAAAGGPFLPGWPTPLSGFIPDEILPYVGRGNPNSPAAADVDGDGIDEVINAGLGGNIFALNKDGDPVRIMESTRTYYGENATVDELASLPVINNPSGADLDGDGRLDIINGTAGTGLVNVASNGGLRAEFDHSVSAWVAENGYFADGFPQKVWDYQFFMNYTVADIDNSGTWNVISGDGGYFVYAPNYDGTQAPGFPKFTSQWHIATPAVGDVDRDERIDIAANTREGWLWAWGTNGHVGGPAERPLPAIQWASFQHDDHNTSNYGSPLPAYPRQVGPSDSCAEGACCCSATERGRGAPAAGALMSLLLFATLSLRRRRDAVSRR